jgi:hypothetical protein
MSIFASNFGGPPGMFFGCIILLLIPIITAVWAVVQLSSLFASERLPRLVMALILLFALVPGFIVATTWRDIHTLRGYDKLLFNVCAFGLVLLPLTLVREAFRFVRDRRPPHRKARRHKTRYAPPEEASEGD